MFKDVEALLAERDKEILIEYVDKANSIEGDCLEIGSYRGGSAVHICHAMSESKKLDAVDINKHEEFFNNIKRYGFENCINFYHMDYKHFIKNHAKDKKYSFIFVDNSHAYEDTKLPRELLWENMSVGGYMVFHDYSHPNYPGVKRYLDEFGSSCQDANIIGRDGCCFIIQKK